MPYTEALALSRASQRGSKLGTSGSAFQSDSTDQAARLSELEQECEKYKLEVIGAALFLKRPGEAGVRAGICVGWFGACYLT